MCHINEYPFLKLNILKNYLISIVKIYFILNQKNFINKL